jgi:hypothetical protein
MAREKAAEVVSEAVRIRGNADAAAEVSPGLDLPLG